VTLLLKGNRPLFVQIDAVAIASGQECRVAVIDITARKQAEDEREKLLVQLDAVLNSINEGVVIADLSGNILTMNSSALAFHEYASVEQVRQQLHQLLDTFEVSDLEGSLVPFGDWPLSRVLRGEQFADFELRVKRKDKGTTRIGSYSGRPVQTRSGDVILAVITVRDITERKRAEEALRESEQRFASFMFHLPAAAWIKDLHGRYVYANVKAERIFATPLSALLDKTDDEVFPPETARQFQENDARVLSEGGSLQTTELLRQTDGIEHHSIVSKFAVPGPDGQPAYVAGMALDITESRRLEAEIQRLASFPLMNPNPVLELDANGRMTFCNPAAKQFLEKGGYVTSINPLIPQDMPEILQSLRNNKPGQFLRSIEIDGRFFEELVYVTPQFQSVRIYTMDITERKRAEEALRLENNFTDTVINSMPGIFYVFDDHEQLLRWNKRLEDFSGRSPEVMTTLRPHDIVAEENRGLLESKLSEVFVEQQNADVELLLLNAEGRKTPFYCTGSPMVVGDRTYLVGLGVDISRRKLAEEEIERLNTSLAARAAELEDANRELEAFNYTVAHDLRNPLNVVSGYCQVIKELCSDKLDEQCNNYLQETYNGTLRMNRLIEALLQFSRLAHAELKRERVDLSSMAREVAGELKLTGPDRPVTFRIAEGIRADGDANLLRVVLTNLLGNAWKYTATQEEAIIEFAVRELDGRPVFLIRDNGNGFDMADADKLFVPFQRLPGAEECRGFGIGLATVERIIRRHGGQVWAEGAIGKGATFYFTLQS